MANFSEIANMKAEEVEPPKLAPVGDYIFMVTNDPAPRQVSDGAFEIIDFRVQGTQALESVDPKELEEFGGAKGVRTNYSFIFNTDPEEITAFNETNHRLMKFLTEILACGDGKMTISQLLGKAKGSTFRGELGLRQDKNDPERWYSDIKKVYSID